MLRRGWSPGIPSDILGLRSRCCKFAMKPSPVIPVAAVQRKASVGPKASRRRRRSRWPQCHWLAAVRRYRPPPLAAPRSCRTARMPREGGPSKPRSRPVRMVWRPARRPNPRGDVASELLSLNISSSSPRPVAGMSQGVECSSALHLERCSNLLRPLLVRRTCHRRWNDAGPISPIGNFGAYSRLSPPILGGIAGARTHLEPC